MDIDSFLNEAEKGNLPACLNCPWSPKKDNNIAFGKSCTAHGFNWKRKGKVLTMIIVQDPGDTTPQKTGRLCLIHNAQNISDKSAQQMLELWKATVSLDNSSTDSDIYLRHNYWTNSIMHGFSVKDIKTNKPIKERKTYRTNTIDKARQVCSRVLKEQIEILKPQIIIANGETTAKSLYEIKLLAKEWGNFKHCFRSGAYKEVKNNWNNIGYPITVFCTYTTSGKVINQTLSKKYDYKETEKFIKVKLSKLKITASISEFLRERKTDNTNNRGMKYLLNHWLDIGTEIRSQYKEFIKAT